MNIILVILLPIVTQYLTEETYDREDLFELMFDVFSLSWLERHGYKNGPQLHPSLGDIFLAQIKACRGSESGDCH